MGDRREFPRLAVSLDARYLTRGADRNRRATVASLSANGVAFFADEPLDPGTRLDYIEFTIDTAPAAHALRAGAKVVRCKPRTARADEPGFLIGAEFFGIDPADRARLDRYVTENREPSDEVQNPRIELQTPVAVRFQRFDDFVTEVSRNLSRTGMFIASHRPRPVGERFEFILQLGDDFTLVQGRAEVIWIRAEREGPELPPGMGIRFLELDCASESVLSRLIGEHTELSLPRKASGSLAERPRSRGAARDPAPS